jgi:hypothetical protein
MTTATIIYFIDPAYFYANETNTIFRDFLVYQTFETTTKFLSYFFISYLLFFIIAVLLLYSMLWLKPPAPYTKFETIGLAVAIIGLLYVGCKNLYGISGNIQSIIYLLNRK